MRRLSLRSMTRMTGSAEGSESVAALLRARALRGGLQLEGRPEVPLVKHEALARSHVGGGGQRATHSPVIVWTGGRVGGWAGGRGAKVCALRGSVVDGGGELRGAQGAVR